jgi:ABC-type lipoprotein release transport system permease subunit
MAWRNIWRNRRRTVLTLSAIAFACLLLVFMLSFQFGSYDVMINTAVRISTGHLQVQAQDYNEKNDIRLVVTDYETIGTILNSASTVNAYTYRANAFSLASSQDRTYGIMVIGIDPPKEATVSTIKSVVQQGAYLSQEDTNQALLGELLAANLNVTLGDEVTLLGQGRDGSIAATVVTVKGIYRSGQDEFDRSSLQIPLSHFQDVYAMHGAVHAVVAVCDSLKHLDQVEQSVADQMGALKRSQPLVVLDWKDLMPGLAQGIAIDLVSGIIMYLLLVFVVAFSILNTFLMAVFERTREFGVMMAVGVTPGRLTRLLLLESTIMTLFGVVLGVIAGSLITWYFQVHGIDLGGASEIMEKYGVSGRLYPQLSLLSASIGPAAVLVITFMSALYPTTKIRKLRPVEAMTHI